MSKKRSTHLRGNRGPAFADLIRGIAPEQILCVSLDISKYFHVAMIHNGLGEIVTQPFEVDIYQSGFDQLCQAIAQARARTQAQLALVMTGAARLWLALLTSFMPGPSCCGYCCR